MNQDERAIRNWFDDWIRATTEGDLELARGLIADDAVFLVPGVGTMDKESFAVAAAGTDPSQVPDKEYELDSELEAFEITGDRAWVQIQSKLVITVKATGAKTTMAGHSLAVLKREGGRWLSIRDANTMTVVPNQDE